MVLQLIRQSVEISGLEPELTEPKSVVLPLHHISITFSMKPPVDFLSTIV